MQTFEATMGFAGPRSKRRLTTNYRKAWWWSVGMQSLIGFYAYLELDGGNLFVLWFQTLIVFWLCSWLVMWSSSMAPRMVDERFVQFGYAPILMMLILAAQDFRKGSAWVWGATFLVGLVALFLAIAKPRRQSRREVLSNNSIDANDKQALQVRK